MSVIHGRILSSLKQCWNMEDAGTRFRWRKVGGGNLVIKNVSNKLILGFYIGPWLIATKSAFKVRGVNLYKLIPGHIFILQRTWVFPSTPLTPKSLILEKIVETQLRWFWQVERRLVGCVARRINQMRVVKSLEADEELEPLWEKLLRKI